MDPTVRASPPANLFDCIRGVAEAEESQALITSIEMLELFVGQRDPTGAVLADGFKGEMIVKCYRMHRRQYPLTVVAEFYKTVKKCCDARPAELGRTNQSEFVAPISSKSSAGNQIPGCLGVVNRTRWARRIATENCVQI